MSLNAISVTSLLQPFSPCSLEEDHSVPPIHCHNAETIFSMLLVAMLSNTIIAKVMVDWLLEQPLVLTP